LPGTGQLPALGKCLGQLFSILSLTFFRSRDIASEAYVDGVEYLKRELSENDKARKMLDSYTSIEDVRSIVEKAKINYDASSEKRKHVHKWLTRFSSRITYYGQVLDMLAQHHPEYVALAWGALKFVLTVQLYARRSFCISDR
jgi:hypothetical protein